VSVIEVGGRVSFSGPAHLSPDEKNPKVVSILFDFWPGEEEEGQTMEEEQDENGRGNNIP
jgi:hypothetical protein